MGLHRFLLCGFCSVILFDFLNCFKQLLFCRYIHKTYGGKVDVHFYMPVRMLFLILVNFNSLNEFVYDSRR